MTYTLHTTQLFQDNFRLLPPDQVKLVLSKIDQLQQDPRPIGKNKTRLVGSKKSKAHRMRAGNYRIIYSWEGTTIRLINVDKRSEVYVRNTGKAEVLVDEDQVAENDPTIEVRDVASPATHARSASPRKSAVWFETPDPGTETWGTGTPSPAPVPLPRPITPTMLQRILIPEKFHSTLLACTTDAELEQAMAKSRIPAEIGERILNVVTDPDYEDLEEHVPEKTILEVEDLQRFYDHTLLDLHVTLDPGQQSISRLVTGSSGSWLIKGAPGTGKSSILIEAAIRLHREALRSGKPIRILITTFTNSLAATLRLMLERLYGDAARDFTVCTVDTLVAAVLREAGEDRPAIDEGLLQGVLRPVTLGVLQPDAGAKSQPGRLVGMAPIASMTYNYLLHEIEQVIVGRNMTDRDDYLTAPRTGRKVLLGDIQRNRIWDIAMALERELQSRNLTTFARKRRRAAHLLESGNVSLRFDAIMVDEAQDLDPNAIRMMVELAKSPDGQVQQLCLAADDNQMIYGSGMSWVSIHPDLRLQGRTRNLSVNHRSTRQIVEAASGFLTGAELERNRIGTHRNIGPLPVMIQCHNLQSELDHILRFFDAQCGELQRDTDLCAILVPEEQRGRNLEFLIRKRGLQAKFMKRQDTDLNYAGIKILTHHAAKGLEFPVVALSMIPLLSDFGDDSEESQEDRMKFQRLIHMAMTRAMRSLLVTLPDDASDTVLQKFPEPAWQRIQMSSTAVPIAAH